MNRAIEVPADIGLGNRAAFASKFQKEILIYVHAAAEKTPESKKDTFHETVEWTLKASIPKEATIKPY